MFNHIIHGLLIVTVVFFALPAVLSTAVNYMTSGKSSWKPALKLVTTGLRSIYRGIKAISEIIVDSAFGDCPNHKKRLRPILKQILTYTIVVVGLILVSFIG